MFIIPRQFFPDGRTIHTQQSNPVTERISLVLTVFCLARNTVSCRKYISNSFSSPTLPSDIFLFFIFLLHPSPFCPIYLPLPESYFTLCSAIFPLSRLSVQ